MENKPNPLTGKPDRARRQNLVGKTGRRESSRYFSEEMLPADRPDVNRIVDGIIQRYDNFGKTE